MRLRHLVFAACCSGALAGPARGAGDLERVQQMQREGRLAAALLETDRYLAADPRDARLLFMKAGLLADANRAPEAMELLQQLSQAHPSLAEPHNNLAVLYAGNGDYDKARESLEQALRLNPGFATAHENLGDVHAALAARAYATAQRLDATRTATLARKLDLVRQLNAPASRPSPAPSLSSPAAAAAP